MWWLREEKLDNRKNINIRKLKKENQNFFQRKKLKRRRGKYRKYEMT